ncbi:YchJ family protein [Nocardioides ferulae]|uniref:YchJ family protein n=1 Tax=Nocardioides ferulae TaxID=2340821 RepID=UPI000EAE666C|nr:YchJ family protein [Nocardioides ferulae]
MDLQPACPCGTETTYDACCGRLHRGADRAETAEELMRSRYAAYAVGDAAYVFATWHPRTRPDDLDGRTWDHALRWTGLEVVDTVAGGPGDDEGVVEFVARYDSPAGPGELHERSRFLRRAGRWVYLDGDVS